MKYLKMVLIILTGLFFLSGCNTLRIGIQRTGAIPPEYWNQYPGPLFISSSATTSRLISDVPAPISISFASL